MVSCAFYCVADARYFLGAAAMVNSLRRAGHREPIFILDCGLREDQRRLLTAETTLVESPGADRAPFLLKTFAPLLHPADVMVLIDADMIVTRSLVEPIETAAAGAVVAFEDPQERFCAQWRELPGLESATPGPYVSSSLVLLPREPGGEILRKMGELEAHVDFDLTFWRANDRDYPYLYADQDVLNAILRATPFSRGLQALARELAATPPYRGLRPLDGDGLRCRSAGGAEPYVLHQFMRKPWLERTYHGLYSELFARALLRPWAAVSVPPRQIPLRLRDGRAAHVSRAAVNLKDYARWHLWDRVPAPVGRRLEDARRRVRGRLA